MKVEEIIKILDLKPHPEGGYFSETYRSDEILLKEMLPVRYSGNRFFGTCIYYLLTRNTFSMLHKLESDEIFHFYLGEPVEMLNLFSDGKGEIITLGTDLISGMRPQFVVQKNVWQGARLKDGGNFALLGTSVAPGFEFDDYKTDDRNILVKEYPDFKEMIFKLTK